MQFSYNHTFTVQNDVLFELTTFDEGLACGWKDATRGTEPDCRAKAEYDTRLLAQQLGTNYRSLMYWLRGDRPIPAELLPRICVLLKNSKRLMFSNHRQEEWHSRFQIRSRPRKKSFWSFPI